MEVTPLFPPDTLARMNMLARANERQQTDGSCVRFGGSCLDHCSTNMQTNSRENLRSSPRELDGR